MKKFFKFAKSKKEGSGSATASTESLAATGYLVKEKDLSKLHKAAWTGDLAKVKQLAKKDPNPLDKENRTPLHLACARGYAPIVQELVEWKAKVNLGDNDARTPLIKAVECGHDECVQILLDANADPNTVDKNQDAPMHYAARQGSIPITKILLGPDRTNIDLPNKEGQTALHLSVTQRYDKLAEFLLDEGADPNIQDGEGRTPLMHSCHDGTESLTKLLLEFQADTQYKDKKGWTADDIAIMASHDECRKLLGTVSNRQPKPAPGQKQNDLSSPAKGATAKADNIFSGPAIDQAEDSLAEESQMSKISEAAGGDSWGDTDEESDAQDMKRKKVPTLDLRKLRDLNESVEDPDSKIPRLNNAAAASNVKRSESTNSKSHIPIAKKDSGGSHPPVSARSSTSVKSALSFGGNVDSNWSDDESLFSSANDPKKNKVPLVRTSTKEDQKEEPTSEWSDDDMSAVETKGKNPNVIPSTPRGSNSARDPEDVVGVPLGSSTARSDKEKTDAEIAKEKHKRPPAPAKGEMLADLGLSDVSDVSDPDFGDDSPPLSSQHSLKHSANKKPPPGPNKRIPSTGDEWETDTPRSTAGKPKMPLSARSTASNWDSSIAEEDEDDKPIRPNLAALGRAKQASQESLSQWDSEPVEATQNSQTKDSPADAAMPTKPQTTASKPNNSQKEDSLWDSDVEGELAPPALPVSAPPKSAPSVNVDKAILPDSPAAAHKGAALLNSSKAGADEDSKWDSTDGGSTPRQPNVDRTGPPVAKGNMMGADDDDTDDDDFEEEEESTWEKERKEKALIQKQKSEEREQQWEAEYRQRQEQHRLEAQEELRKEKEEEERLRKQAEEEERLAREEQEREAQEEEEERERLRKEADERKREAEKEELERKKREEEQRKQLQEHQKREEEKKKETAAMMTAPAPAQSGAVSDDEEEERSRQIRLRRQQAEQELAAAKKVNGYHGTQPDNQNLSLLDDEEDTFNDLEVDDLDGPPIKVETMAHTNGVGLGGLDEDALSYSSTEQEASIHEPLGTSGIAHSSALNLSFNSDTLNVVRLQDQVREARRLLDKERSTRTSMENKRKNLEKEKSELITKLEEVTRAKSQLEQNKIDVDAKLRTLQYQTTEETEKRRNAEVLLSKTKEQLARKEDQYTTEVEAKQKAELSMRNLQMELRTTLSNIKQLEEEKEDFVRQLQHEKSSRQLQEQINEEQQRLAEQLKLSEEAAQPARREELAAAIGRLEDMDESRKSALESVEKLRAELYATKMELERQKSRFKDDHGLMTSENEDLQVKVEDLKADIKLQEEALAHATMQYNITLSQLRTDNTVLTSSVEREKSAREKLDVEVESLRSRLSSTSSELEKSQAARSELERNNHKEHEEWSRLLDRRDVELNSLKETNQNLSLRVGAAEAKVSAVENELHIANATLIERTNQLSTIQRELDMRRGNQENMDESFRKDREDNVRMTTKIESLSERLTSVQHENLNLKQQLDEARLRDLSREQGESGDKMSTMMASLRAEHDKARTVLEEKNTMLQEQNSHLRDEVRTAESRKSNLEQQYQRAQSELTDATKRLSVAEASLEVAQRAKEQIEHERLSLRGEMDRLQSRLDDSREKLAEANAKAAHYSERLEQVERNSMATSQQLMSQSADVHIAKNKSELEVEMHRLELENAKLEAALKHEKERVASLQKELNDTTQVRNTMEALLTNLKTANAHLDEKLSEAATSRTIATQEAEDSRQMWETEVKGRSKLGLRIAQLEREKQEIQGTVDEEKRKTRKAMELKRNTEVKLESELQKATQLQKEVATLKAHLKASKKRLRELDTSDNRINILSTDFNNERREMERTISTTRRQLEDVQNHLSSEIETKDKLEHKTRQLTSELKNLKHMEKTHHKLEKAKRKLEEDLASYKNHISNNYIERSELERIKAELEAKSRVELNAKLEEVNNYLEEQALARQRLDSMRDSNENDMRKDFEKTRKELMDEVNKLRGTYHETATTIESKDFEAKRFKDLYESELKLRERLAEKLEQASEKAAKAQIFMDRQFTQSTGIPQNNWMTSSAPSPLLLGKSAPGHGVNDLSQKIRAELNRSIAKHMEKSPQIDISLPPRSMDDINLGASSFNKASTDYLQVLKKNYML